jgi:hypothetical protein
MIIKTEDGYTFYLLEDGRVTDNPNPKYTDISWESLQLFLEDNFNQALTFQPVGVGW